LFEADVIKVKLTFFTNTDFLTFQLIFNALQVYGHSPNLSGHSGCCVLLLSLFNLFQVNFTMSHSALKSLFFIFTSVTKSLNSCFW